MNLLTALTASAAKGALDNPQVQVNRDRLGVVVHDGFAVRDTWLRMKPGAFVIGLIGLAASGYGWWKRPNTEARVLYSITGLASLGLAVIARPSIGNPPAPAAPGQPEPAPNAAVAWLDHRANTLRGQDPNFAGNSLRRLLAETSLDKIAALKALADQ